MIAAAVASVGLRHRTIWISVSDVTELPSFIVAIAALRLSRVVPVAILIGRLSMLVAAFEAVTVVVA